MTGNRYRYRYFLFNRDEQRKRPREESPQIFRPHGEPSYLAPVDPQGRGTWIAVNEYGVSAAILNDYQSSATPAENRPFTSRGILPLLAVSKDDPSTSPKNIAEELAKNSFQPFRLLIQSPGGTGYHLHWDGHLFNQTPLNNIALPVTTSSWRSLDVEKFRQSLFEKTVDGRAQLHQLLEFHGFHDPEEPGCGPAMVREDATTRSLTIIRVGPEEVSMRHQRFDPENRIFESPTEVRLPRRYPR